MKLSVGIRNRSTARTALRSMNANNSSRARVARLCVRLATTASRALKKIACLRSISQPPALACRNAAVRSGTWTKPKCAVTCQKPSASFRTSRRSARGMRGTSANLIVNATTFSCRAPICWTWRTSSGGVVSAIRVRKIAVPGTRGILSFRRFSKNILGAMLAAV